MRKFVLGFVDQLRIVVARLHGYPDDLAHGDW